MQVERKVMNANESRAHIQQRPNDLGPVYKETDLTRCPVEPFNTFSNLIFLFLVIYWSCKTRLNTLKHPLTTVCMPILLLGYIGGTVYHATRSNTVWLWLDYMPILVLALSAGIYLWRQLIKSYALTFLLVVGPLPVCYFMLKYARIPDNFSITAVYLGLALNILLPAILYCVFKNRTAWLTLTLAFSFFIIAVVFRQIDRFDIFTFMPHGTHFLWHIFGGVSSFFMIKYIYLAENVEVEEKAQRKLLKRQ
jgi:hemolysin III